MESWRRNLYTVWTTQIISLMGFGFMHPFIPYFIQDIGITDPDQLRFWTGVIASAPGFLMGIMAPIWGGMADRFGRKMMILRSMIAGAIIVSFMSLAQSVWMVFLLRCLQGFLCGTITASATLVSAGTPEDKQSSALGFLSSSTFIGFATGPLIGGFTAEWLGYRKSFLIGACILAIGAFLVLFLVKELRWEETDSNPHRHLPRPMDTSRLRDVLTPSMLMFLGILFCIRFGRTLPIPFIPIFIQDIRGQIDGSAAIMGTLSSGAGVMTAISAIIAGRLGDRFDRVRLISMLLAAGALIAFPIFFIRTLPLFSLFYILAAFSAGGVEPLMQAHISVNTPPEKRGLFFGIQTLVGSMGWFAAPLLGSAISIRLGIEYLYLVLSGVLVAGFFLSLRLIRSDGRHVPCRHSST